MNNLYYIPECPFCQNVLIFAQTNSIELDLKNIHEEENLEMLLKIGGKKTVPFLHNEEKNISMYESDSIIIYLQSQI